MRTTLSPTWFALCLSKLALGLNLILEYLKRLDKCSDMPRNGSFAEIGDRPLAIDSQISNQVK